MANPITGKVLDFITNEDISGARVFALKGIMVAGKAWSKSDGSYEIENELAADDDCILLGIKSGYNPVNTSYAQLSDTGPVEADPLYLIKKTDYL